MNKLMIIGFSLVLFFEFYELYLVQLNFYSKTSRSDEAELEFMKVLADQEEDFVLAFASASEEEQQYGRTRKRNSVSKKQPVEKSVEEIKKNEIEKSKKLSFYYSNASKFEELFDLGQNYQSTVSACKAARWILGHESHDHSRYQDCREMGFFQSMREKVLRNSTHMQQISENDTIYVLFTQLDHFVMTLLPHLTEQIVLIIGQTGLIGDQMGGTRSMKHVNQTSIDILLNHELIYHLFCMNIPTHIIGSNRLYHAKLSPYPYGVQEMKPSPTLFTFTKTMRQEFENPNAERDLAIFHGYPRSQIPNKARDIIAKQVKLENPDYFVRARHFFDIFRHTNYVLSPNGDRPECYRHYQAIGLGATPITELDTFFYRHFGDNIIYNNSNWNLTLLNEEYKTIAKKDVNRNLIFEKYWMDYCNAVVGKELTWYDFYEKRPFQIKEKYQNK